MPATPQKPIGQSPLLSVDATVTSKGQITIPVESRRLLGLKPGDKLRLEHYASGETHVRKADEFPFNRFRGMGTGIPELEEEPDSIVQYFRALRGHDEFDHPESQ